MLHPSLRRLLRFLPFAALGLALSTPPASAAPQRDHDRPFLWRIDGGQAPSFLFGTIHAGVKASELHPIVDSALHKSKLFVMETAPEDELAASRNAVPMDLALARHARQIGNRVATLETLEFQRSLLGELIRAGGGGAEDLAAIFAQDSQAIASLVAAYRSGSLDEIVKFSRPEDARIQEILLDQRNRRWVNQLTPILRKGGVFAAVGVGHAPGPSGLIELLAQRGFQLRQYAS